MDRISRSLYGKIFTDSYQEMSDGGPNCYADMTDQFRGAITIYSAITNVYIMKKLLPLVLKSKEINSKIGAAPGNIEKFVGVIGILTELVQAYFKFSTQRGIFMFNPCHVVVSVYSYLLLTPKTRNTSVLYICITRWLYGTYLALVFPSLEGLDESEIKLFFFEHYMGTIIAPLILVLSGRYDYPEWKSFGVFQLFGFSSHVLYQRLVLAPLSTLTWANLNFTLCRPANDPFLPIVGQWYYLFADYYLNLNSLIIFTWNTLLCGILRKLFQTTIGSKLKQI